MFFHYIKDKSKKLVGGTLLPENRCGTGDFNPHWQRSQARLEGSLDPTAAILIWLKSFVSLDLDGLLKWC